MGRFDSYLDVAVKSGDVSLVSFLLRNRHTVDDNPLRIALTKNDIEMVQCLVQNGADVNAIDKEGHTPLCTAITNNNVEIVLCLIQNGADVNIRNTEGRTPLCTAIENNNVEMVQWLIQNGADVNARNKLHTPLCTAITNNNADMVQCLIENGAEVNVRDKDCLTPLWTAINDNNGEMVQYLIQNGADLNETYPYCDFVLKLVDMVQLQTANEEDSANDSILEKKRTPLQMALERGAFEIAEMLINAGVDVNEPNDNGSTPLHIAVKNSDGPSIVSQLALLIGKGADVNATDKQRNTPLLLACGFESKEPVSVLIVNGADVNAADNLGFTPLHFAADVSFPNTLMLIAAGADVTALNENGETPLHIVSRSNQQNRDWLRIVVVALIEKGADVNGVDYDGNEPLHSASLRELSDTVQVLLENKANVNAASRSNNTALHYATQSKFPSKSLVQILLHFGADITAVNSDGLTPLTQAKIREAHEIVDLILSRKLFEAARNGDEELFEWVLAQGADDNWSFEGKRWLNRDFTPLQIAADYGQVNVVKRLLDEGAKVNGYLKHNLKITPLHLACKNGHIHVVKVLLERGASVRGKYFSGASPSYLAKTNGHWEVAEYLESWQSRRGIGAFISSLVPRSPRDGRLQDKIDGLSRQLRDKEDECAILRREKEHGMILIEELLSKPDRDEDAEAQKSMRIEMNVLQEKNDKIDQLHSQISEIAKSIEELKAAKVSKIADIMPVEEPDAVTLKSFVTTSFKSVTNSFKKKSCILEAVTAGDEELVVRILGKNPDLNMRDNDKQTPLFLACKYNRHDIIRLLVDRGADVNASNKGNATPLYIASENGYADVVDYLLNHKADANEAARNNATPLLIAADNGHVLVVETLLKRAVLINKAMKGGYTPLYVAARNDRREVVQMLLEHGADVNASSVKMMSPLHRSVIEGHQEVVELLLEYGADTAALNSKNETPLSLAEQHGKNEVRDLIVCWRGMSQSERYSLTEIKRRERKERKTRLMQESKSNTSSSLMDLTVDIVTESLEELRDKARALNMALTTIPEEVNINEIDEIIQKLVVRQERVSELSEISKSELDHNENVTKTFFIINQGVVHGTIVGNCRDIYVGANEC